MRPKIVTIGVYGFDKYRFFQALIDAKIDAFCDIRLRRGMRGSLYAFVNSASLQQHLCDLGIRYIYMKELAPSKEIREKQKQEDELFGIAKRSRATLGQAFIQAYEQGCLSHFDSGQFLKNVGEDAQVIGLFCVERDPDACHRSLAAKRLARDLGLHVEHIRP